MNINLYTINNCEKCLIMKDYLKLIGIPYSEIKFKDLYSLSDILKDKIYVVNAPVLSINETYYDEPCLFEGDIIRYDLAELLDKYMGD
jgi:glutaredoxin